MTTVPTATKPRPARKGSRARTASDNGSPHIDISEWGESEFAVLPIEGLLIDEYQRPLTSLADKIAAEFDPLMVGTLVVSARDDGTNALVDGQTRAEGARRAGRSVLPCVVLRGLTREREADLFARFQKERRNVKPFDRFRAEVIAGRPRAVAIKRIVEAEGFQFKENPQRQARTINAIVALETMYERDPAKMRQMLSLVRRTWPDNPFATNERLLRGLFRFLEEQAEVDEDRFVERLAKTMPSDLSRRATQLQEARGMSGRAPTYMAETIESEYRRRRR